MTMKSAGKMKSAVGKSILIGAFAASSSASERRRREVVGQVAQRLAERETELLALDQRPDERGHLGRVEALGHALERTLAPLADAKLRQDERELVGERAARGLDEPRDRPVEPEPGLDRDGKQVECVRQVLVDAGAASRARRARTSRGMRYATTPKSSASSSAAPRAVL